MSNDPDIREINQLVEQRCIFFANRVDTYAKRLNMSSREVLEHLLAIAARQGETAITGVIDAVMPAELHSSQMPQ